MLLKKIAFSSLVLGSLIIAFDAWYLLFNSNLRLSYEVGIGCLFAPFPLFLFSLVVVIACKQSETMFDEYSRFLLIVQGLFFAIILFLLWLLSGSSHYNY